MMRKCKCGKWMDIRLRTVIFSDHVEIVNVPVHSCKPCKRSIVCQEAKPELKKLVNSLGEAPNEQRIDFCDYNEYAYLLFIASDKSRIDTPLEQLVGERINQLLDLLLMAQSVGDSKWQDEIERKLSQITVPDVLLAAHHEHNEL